MIAILRDVSGKCIMGYYSMSSRFNLSSVSSVTQAIPVTEKQNTAIKMSVKSLVRPFNIVRFKERWDIQKPSSAEYFELSLRH